MDEDRIRQIFKEELETILGGDRYTVSKLVQILDGRNIQVGRTTGTKIGTASDQKLGFFGKTPIVRPAAPTDAATIITTLQALGLTA